MSDVCIADAMVALSLCTVGEGRTYGTIGLGSTPSNAPMRCVDIDHNLGKNGILLN
jgi:hypothetical protein